MQIKLSNAAKNGFDHLKRIVEKEGNCLQKYTFPDVKEKAQYQVDKHSETLFLQEEDQEFVPIRVYGDGNCAYRSMSVHLFGKEKHFTEMRVRIAMELTLFKDFYLNDAMGDERETDFVRRLAQTTPSGGTQSLSKAFEIDVLDTCQKNSWAGIWQICAFASISGHPVKSIYPKKNRILRADLHNVFLPRPSQLKSQEIYRIMWTRMKPFTGSWWTPNHFVPCINKVHLPAHSNISYLKTSKFGSFSNPKPVIAKEPVQRRNLTLKDFLTTQQKRNKKTSTPKKEVLQSKLESPIHHVHNNSENEKDSMKSNQSCMESIQRFHNYAKTPEVHVNIDQDSKLVRKELNGTEGYPKLYSDKQKYGDRVCTPTENDDIMHEPLIFDPLYEKNVCSVTAEIEVSTEYSHEESVSVHCFGNEQANNSPYVPKNDKNKQDKTERSDTIFSNESMFIVRAEKRKQRSGSTPDQHKSISTKSENRKKITSFFSVKDPKTPLPTRKELTTCNSTPKRDLRSESQPKQLFHSKKPDKIENSTSNKDIKSTDKTDLKEHLPLNVSRAWFQTQGETFFSNRSRSLMRDKTIIMDGNINIGMQRSKKKGNLLTCHKELEDLIDHLTTGSQKHSHLSAVKKICEELLYGPPILLTQKASEIYQTFKNKALNKNQEVQPKQSVEVYEMLSRYLCIMQVYFNGKAYLTEDRGTKLVSVVEEINGIIDSQNEQKLINDHVENQIGKIYNTALDYLDSERDRDTITFLLTKVTSVTFMAKLENIKSRKRIKKASDIMPRNLKLYQQIIDEYQIKEGLSRQQKRCILRRVKELKKKEALRHHMTGRGRMLKCEQKPNIVPVLEYEFGEGDVEQRGGGGMEAHSRLSNTIKYKSATNKTRMLDARETILASGSPDFTISLSTYLLQLHTEL